MPVDVLVPIRIAIDPAALGRMDEIEEAALAAVRRAMTNAASVVGRTYGARALQRAEDPSFVWTGDALSELSTLDRRRCEEAVRRSIARAVAATAPQRPDAPRESLLERLTTGVSEIVDETRLASLAGLYTIPGYRDGRPQVITIVQPLRTGDAAPSATWFPAAADPRTLELIRATLRQRYGDDPPAVSGAIWLLPDGRIGVAAHHRARGLLWALAWEVPVRLEPAAGGADGFTTTPLSISSGDTFVARFAGPGRTTEDRRRLFLSFYGRAFGAAIRAEAARLPGGAITPVVVANRLAHLATIWAAEQERAPGGGHGGGPPICYLELQAGAARVLLPSPVAVAPDFDVELVPITRPMDPVEAEVGPPAGGGRGPLGAPPAENAEGAPWPPSVGEGSRLECRPYLAEPALSELVDDRGLTNRMRAIARRLAVPECAFAGRFALNCARAISQRARDVGMTSVTATSETIVSLRHDGGGNNGFLDVRPGASPEFAYLRALARLAADVNEFGRDVVSAHLDRRNDGLVRLSPDARPDGASWGIRYVNDLGEAVTRAYQRIYAETCRVLLLQQLRSSRGGITARQSRFDDTLAAFTAVLDILGEGFVRLSTLVLAIDHAQTVGFVGSVRQVLSIPEQRVIDRVPPVEVDATPPIEYVPARILSAVGDAVIERRAGGAVAVHEGKTWTKGALEEAMAVRRALINRVDPLFLQVEYLEGLYRESERRTDFARTYLERLLEEMSKANNEMTDRASMPDDGASFALEASQYVAAEGGRDSRGLRFRLQGIHALADEQVRGVVGGDPLYVEGVNRAVGHKADFDTFVAVFSTAGIIVLGLLCAPLGAVAAAAITGVAGLAFTIHDVADATRQSDLYHALEDPELFQSWQEVQLAQLMAAISVAFSVFDAFDVGRGALAIVGTARRALRVSERVGVGMAVRSVGRSARREIVRSMTAEVLENAVRQALTAAAIAEAMNLLLPRVITPWLVPWIREQAVSHGTLAEVDAALGTLAPEVAPAPADGGTR